MVPMPDDKPPDGIRIMGIMVTLAGVICLLVSLYQHLSYGRAEVEGTPSGADANPTVILIGVICLVGGIIIMAVARKSKSG